MWYAREIIKDGSRVNQNAVKRNMEARNNYLLEKKGSEKKSRDRGRPSTTDSHSKEKKTTKARGNKQ